jgi:hypothetical protein
MDFARYLDIPSFLFVALGLLAAGLAGQFRPSALKIASRIMVPIGLMGSIIGFVHMLRNLNDPTEVGPAFAVALLTTAYALGLKALIDLLQQRCEMKNETVAIGWRVGGCLVLLGSLAIACRLQSPFGMFLNLEATLLLVLTLVIVALAGGWGEGRLPRNLNHYLPRLGLFGLVLTVIAVLALSDPPEIGPVMAFGLLTYFYAMVAHVLVALIHGRALPEKDPPGMTLFYLISLGLFMAIYALLALKMSPGSGPA